MDDIAGVHVLDGLTQLIHDVTLVYILQDVASLYHIVQVRVCQEITHTSNIKVQAK